MKKSMKHKKQSGFTLIELMIVVAIVIILTAVAIPSYGRYVIKARREQAIAMMLDLQRQLEQNYVRDNAYSDKGIILPIAEYYIYSFPMLDSNSYTIQADAQAGQVNDTGCTPLILDSLGNKKPPECW